MCVVCVLCGVVCECICVCVCVFMCVYVCVCVCMCVYYVCVCMYYVCVCVCVCIGLKITEVTTDRKADIESAAKQTSDLNKLIFQRDGWHKSKNLLEAWNKHVLEATKCACNDIKSVKAYKMNLHKELAECGSPLV